MAKAIWNVCSKAFVRRALAAGTLCVLTTGTSDRPAAACGYDPESIEEFTTFDPSVAAEPGGPGLNYDPFVAGFGGPCEECAKDAMGRDWDGYFDGGISLQSWESVLWRSPIAELTQLELSLTHGVVPPASLGAIVTAVTLRPTLRERVVRALGYAKIAREVGVWSTFEQYAPEGGVPIQSLRAALGQSHAVALKRADAFMLQRTAFLRLRLAFYQRDWPEVIRAVAADTELTRPSADLAWRARYYLAGALRRTGNLAQANLELARIHAGWPALAGVTAQDFQPMQDQDWQQSLQLASGPREQTLLWRLVGLKQDAFAAAQEIATLEPTSELLGLLLVRELARIESVHGLADSGRQPATSVAAQRAAYAKLDRLIQSILAVPGVDRPWLLHLLSGHIAAKRGDLTATRHHLEQAQRARPGDVKVEGQARASLALALALQPQLKTQSLEEIATAVRPDDWQFGRQATVVGEVRAHLAAAFTRHSRSVEAVFFTPSSETIAQSRIPIEHPVAWASAALIRRMIARTHNARTEFERFMLAGSYDRAFLYRVLALRYMLDGKFADAAVTLGDSPSGLVQFDADPFAKRIVDCHDCDRGWNTSGEWTITSFAQRLDFLSRQANGQGDNAALAAFDVGTGLYNITWHGNSRHVQRDGLQPSFDTQPAERWYRRAFGLAHDRELKVQAAFFAAKAERAGLITKESKKPWDRQATNLPIPTTWYPVVRSFADTQYYQQILAECGSYRNWVSKAEAAKHQQ